MKSTLLFEAIGGAKEKYLSASEKVRKPFSRYAGWVACAACFSIAVICLTLFRPQSPGEIIDPTPTISESLQKINLPSEFNVNGMGYEGYSAYDISEITGSSPLAPENVPETMPAFKNKSYNPYMTAYGLTERELLAVVYDVLDFFDIKIYDNDFTGIKKHLFTDSNGDPRGFLIPDDTVTRIELTVKFGKIEVTANGTVTIWFDKAPIIPEEYDINVNPEETLLYCAEMFAGLLRYEKPVVLGDKTVYDGAGDPTEQLINKTYEYANFYFDSDGNLSTVRIFNDLLVAEKLGDYPTITREEAQALLLEGIYYSNYIETEFPGEEYIAHVTVAYRGSNLDKTWLPYYKFYVELPDKVRDDGKKTYATYYVPAIDQEYLESYPTADIKFEELS
ncbi:MAG: hypothetical protein E7627_02975 [Ruminococcaceae bacterium]|nr:hypothetical protein [Oscillospiraceae bacterium]